MNGPSPSADLARVGVVRVGALHVGPSARPVTSGVRVVHVIARLNLGGPASMLAGLIAGGSPDVEHVVISGTPSDDEASWDEYRDTVGAQIHLPGFGPQIRPTRDVAAAGFLRSTLVQLGPDVVHTHTAKAGLIGRVAPPEPMKSKGKAAGKGRGARKPPPNPRSRRALVAATLISLTGLVVGVQPLRADAALYRVLQAEAADDASSAVAAAEDAARIGFWDPGYTHRAGTVYQAVGELDEALAFYRTADQRGSGQLESALSAARGLSTDAPDHAMEWFDRALQLEPQHPELLLEVATFYAANDREGAAVELVDRVLDIDPDNDEAAALRAELDGA